MTLVLAKHQYIPVDSKQLRLSPSKPTVVAFTAKWCGHCHRSKGFLQDMLRRSEANRGYEVNVMDDGLHKTLTKRFGIQGYPTVLVYDHKNDRFVNYGGPRETATMEQFLANIPNDYDTWKDHDRSVYVLKKR